MDGRREHPSALVETQIRSKMEWRRKMGALPFREKVSIVIEMQRRLAPIIAQRRPLQWRECPWEIDP